MKSTIKLVGFKGIKQQNKIKNINSDRLKHGLNKIDSQNQEPIKNLELRNDNIMFPPQETQVQGMVIRGRKGCGMWQTAIISYLHKDNDTSSNLLRSSC